MPAGAGVVGECGSFVPGRDPVVLVAGLVERVDVALLTLDGELTGTGRHQFVGYALPGRGVALSERVMDLGGTLSGFRWPPERRTLRRAAPATLSLHDGTRLSYLLWCAVWRISHTSCGAPSGASAERLLGQRDCFTPFGDPTSGACPHVVSRFGLIHGGTGTFMDVSEGAVHLHRRTVNDLTERGSADWKRVVANGEHRPTSPTISAALAHNFFRAGTSNRQSVAEVPPRQMRVSEASLFGILAGQRPEAAALKTARGRNVPPGLGAV